MSIRFIGYPTRKTTGSLDSYTWDEIKDILDNGRAQQMFSLGDTKDGATLIELYSHRCIFSLGNVGNACIASSSSVPTVRPPYMDITQLGWYQGTSYARSKGITRSSVLSSLPQDLRNVMKTHVEKKCGIRRANSADPDTELKYFDLYPPNMEEWIQYSQFMPSGSFWLRDIVWYEYGRQDYWHVGVDITSGGYFPYDEYHGYTISQSGTMTGTETKPIVLFFEV